MNESVFIDLLEELVLFAGEGTWMLLDCPRKREYDELCDRVYDLVDKENWECENCAEV